MTDKAKILVVDDDSDICELVEEMIVDTYEVKTAHSGNEADQVLKDEVFDLVISDYKMPGLNGAKLAKKYPDIPFLIITGLEKVPSSVQNLEYLSKPIRGAHLLAKIVELLGQRAAG